MNGYRHKAEVQGNRTTLLPQTLPNHYRISLPIDDEDVIIENSKIYGFRVFRVLEPDDMWVEKVLDEAERVRKLEEDS